MATAQAPTWHSRTDQTDFTRLVWAFVISLGLHLAIYGGYYTGKRFDIWAHLPAWLRPVKTMVEFLEKKQNPPPAAIPKEEDIPVVFIDVSPAQATPEPPKTAKYYSDKNSQAANQEQPDKLANLPRITGTQEEMAKTEDIPREKFVPLQPSRPVQAAKEKQEEMVPKTTLAPGDLTLAKPDLLPKKGEGQAPQPKPRTVEEAMARLPDRRLPGIKMKQEGGVSRHLELSSLDAKATPFGSYDAALVDAIANSWYKLLDDQEYAADYRGKVVLQFHLHADGRISDVNVSENTAGSIPGLLCETAVDKPSPFERFPAEMRRIVGETRSIQFTFYYN